MTKVNSILDYLKGYQNSISNLIQNVPDFGFNGFTITASNQGEVQTVSVYSIVNTEFDKGAVESIILTVPKLGQNVESITTQEYSQIVKDENSPVYYNHAIHIVTDNRKLEDGETLEDKSGSNSFFEEQLLINDALPKMPVKVTEKTTGYYKVKSKGGKTENLSTLDTSQGSILSDIFSVKGCPVGEKGDEGMSKGLKETLESLKEAPVYPDLGNYSKELQDWYNSIPEELHQLEVKSLSGDEDEDEDEEELPSVIIQLNEHESISLNTYNKSVSNLTYVQDNSGFVLGIYLTNLKEGYKGLIKKGQHVSLPLVNKEGYVFNGYIESVDKIDNERLLLSFSPEHFGNNISYRPWENILLSEDEPVDPKITPSRNTPSGNLDVSQDNLDWDVVTVTVPEEHLTLSSDSNYPPVDIYFETEVNDSNIRTTIIHIKGEDDKYEKDSFFFKRGHHLTLSTQVGDLTGNITTGVIDDLDVDKEGLHIWVDEELTTPSPVHDERWGAELNRYGLGATEITVNFPEYDVSYKETDNLSINYAIGIHAPKSGNIQFHSNGKLEDISDYLSVGNKISLTTTNLDGNKDFVFSGYVADSSTTDVENDTITVYVEEEKPELPTHATESPDSSPKDVKSDTGVNIAHTLNELLDGYKDDGVRSKELDWGSPNKPDHIEINNAKITFGDDITLTADSIIIDGNINIIPSDSEE